MEEDPGCLELIALWIVWFGVLGALAFFAPAAFALLFMFACVVTMVGRWTGH